MCSNPQLVCRTVAGVKHYQFVPCGKCNECIKAKQNEFATRVMEEAKNCKNMYFITLTYSPEAVPMQDNDLDETFDSYTGEYHYDVKNSLMTLRNKDITDWKKRVRMNYERHHKETVPTLMYAIVGEYGPKTNRPHYHGIIFCDDPRYVADLEEDWKKNYGYTCFKKINTLPRNGKDEVIATARYVAKYVNKLKSLEYEKVRTKEVVAPRKITSRGFGLSKDFEKLRRHCLALDKYNYDPDTLQDLNTGKRLTKGQVQDIINIIKRRRKYDYNGKTFPLSRYAKERIYYKKDAKGSYKSTTISDLVSTSLQHDFNKNYSDQLRTLASRKGYKVDYQACKDLQDILDSITSSREEAILQTNIQAFQTSIF